MDSDEEAGLRAFALIVGCDVANSSFERPIWIEREGVRFGISRIDAEWREEERLGFRVQLSDASSWLLYYVPELDLWSGIADAGAAGGASSAKLGRHDRPPSRPGVP